MKSVKNGGREKMKAAASFFLLNFKPEKFSTSCQTFAAAGGVDQT